MNASFSPEVVGIIRNKILATIEKVLSIKFPFIPDLAIGVLIHSIIFFFNFLSWERKGSHKQRNCTVRNNVKTDSLQKKTPFYSNCLFLTGINKKNKKYLNPIRFHTNVVIEKWRELFRFHWSWRIKEFLLEIRIMREVLIQKRKKNLITILWLKWNTVFFVLCV